MAAPYVSHRTSPPRLESWEDLRTQFGPGSLGVAEPGAEEGAGPEIHIAEPWKGYDGMNVQEIRRRLGRASGAELASVQLYEAAGKSRRSVLAAVSARLSAPPSG